jgi:2-polyprenyl-3-methyl-5-hydroxy-6-metoxy-1,4-benzoquinol methylase
MHKGNVVFESTQAKVIDCKSCGFAHVNPLPSQAELNEFYEKRFYQNVKTSYFTDYERDRDWWAINYEWVIDDLLKLYKGKKGKSNLRLLDIGSGPGLFLEVAKRRGIEAKGIEPSKEAYEYSTKKYKCDVVNVTLEELDKSVGKFDIIHSSLVLEHILNPLNFIKKSKALLNASGLLCVVVPNDFNPIQGVMKQLGTPEWWVSPFEHLSYFNRKSIKKLFEKAGLEVVHQSVTFPIDLFLPMGQDYLKNPEVGKACHAMRKNFEFNIHKTKQVKLKDDLYKAFAKLDIGRELIIIGRKSG